MNNKNLILAAIGGAAAGIAIANLVSSEKGKEVLGKVGETVSHFANEYKGQLDLQSISSLILSKFKAQ